MDIIAIAPASPSNGSSAPTSTSGAASQDGAFSLLFNEAVAATSKLPRSGQPKDGGHATATTAAPDSPAPVADQQDLEALQAFLADLSPEQLFSLAASPDVGPNLRALLLSTLAGRTGQQPAFFLNTMTFAAGQAAGPLADGLGNPIMGNTVIDPSLLSFTVEPGSVALAPRGNGQSAAEMLAHLQRLISQNNDRVQITASFQPTHRGETPGYLSGPLVVQAGEATAAATAQPAGTVEPALRPIAETAPAPLRQESVGNDGSPRVSVVPQPGSEQSSESGGRQQASQQQNSAAAPASLTLSQPLSDQSATALFTAQFQEASQAVDGARGTTPNTLVNTYSHIQENDVLQQIVQRFTLQNQLHNSRLSLKLHPAELGELKIDVTVKDDALKAHIYAQTRQAQEILDKHLPRLKAILEEHGMRVDDLLVTFSADTLDPQSGQTGSRFSEQMAEFTSPRREQGDNLFHHSFEEQQRDGSETEPSGVNLTV
ncbi:flagellar hook-length control protein FliK [Desulfofustis limnaeus]|uniref:Flagellar hook-length control protein-like C-terminal domain-containing protein n=1 Tax=Desulfofustis limnaeus TaxID=2740163 RepID=A0ABN6M3A3_9BACT|nr:flagellar hook-length control protein FliK [Desulfofustis limnaeus]BDD87335.1 hypothetical protein DPPLL_17000 [Desulfofustis limnaeus]